jgi:hypothetical protein
VIPVHRVIPHALAAVLEKAPLTPEKIAFAWRMAVGPAIDKATTIELQGRELRVRVKDQAWQREVERSASLICARLRELLGDGVVRGIDVFLK